MSDTTLLTNRQIAERAGWWLVRDHGFDEWYPPDYDANINPGYHAYVPMYLESVDVALNLIPPDMPWKLSYDRLYGIDLRTGYGVSIDDVQYTEFEDTPALAICKAWWKWRDQQEDYS